MKPLNKKLYKTIIIAAVNGIFILLLWLPLIQLKFSIFPQTDNLEKREFAKKPTIDELSWGSINDYFADLQSYYNDNIGFRNQLIKLYSGIKIILLHVSPVDKVIIGKNGWLYYSNPLDGSTISDFSGKDPFSIDELKKINDNNKLRAEWFSSRGIKLIIVIPPNKQSVYSEYLPSYYQKSGITRLDQIINNNTSNLEILDLRQTLIDNKKTNLTYYKTDTHWNKYGAFLGYQKIIESLNLKDNYINLKTAQFAQQKLNRPGDLSIFISAPYIFEDYEVVPKNNTIIKKNQDKLIVFHDSFGNNLNPYLEATFKNSIFVQSPQPDYDLIEKVNPKYVIWENVERYSNNLLNF